MTVEFQTEVAETLFRTGAPKVSVATEGANICGRLEFPVTDVDLTVQKVLEHDAEVRIVVDYHLLCERPERRKTSRTTLIDSADRVIRSRQHHEHGKAEHQCEG
jgi:hypothetical protein